MKTINKKNSNHSFNIKDEIMNLPSQLYEIQNIFDKKNNELKNQKINLKNIYNHFNDIQQIIKKLELKIEEKNNKSDSLKSQQKLIFILITSNIFYDFKKQLSEINKEIYQAFLIFIDYEKSQESQLDLFLKNKDDLLSLLYNSFENFTLLNIYNQVIYNNKKMTILTSINKLRKWIKYPFDIIINYIENTFEIIDFKYENTKEEKKLLTLITEKNKVYNELKNIENEITKKEINVKQLYDYSKEISYIIKNYRCIFAHKNTSEDKKQIMKKIKDLIDKLRQNDLYQKNKSNKTINKNNNNNVLKKALSKNEMYVKQISFQNNKEHVKKISKASNNSNQKNINYNSFNKRNNTSHNIFINKDFSETEKFKNLNKLKSKNNFYPKDKIQIIKNLKVNNFDKNKNKKNNNKNINFIKNRIIKIEKIDKKLNENSLNKIDNKSIIDNQSEFSVCDEFEIEKKDKNNDKTLRGSKSLGHFKIINMNKQFKNYLNENLSDNNINDKIKTNNNEGCWASCT